MKSPYTDSLAHTTWECKYHIVFAPKFRRKEIYGALKQDIGMILRELCRRKEVEIINAEACPDHIHMYVSIPPKISISSFVGYLKGKSTLIIFERHANLKYKASKYQSKIAYLLPTLYNFLLPLSTPTHQANLANY